MAVTNASILYPVRFSVSTRYLRVTCNGVTETLTFPTLTIARDYWIANDGQGDDADGEGSLLTLLETCLNTHSEATSFVVGYSADWRITVSHAAANFSILWSHGSTTLDPTIFGFVASDTASGTSVTSPDMPTGLWRPGRFISKDSCDRQTVVGAVSRSISGLVRTARLALPAKERELMFEFVDKSRALDRFASATGPSNTFETLWRDGLSLGRRFRLYEDENDVDTLFISTPPYTYYKTRDLEDPLKQRTSNLALWDVSLRLVRAD